MANLNPSTPIARRAFSLPATRPASVPDAQIEVLFNLPSARIVSFTTTGSGSRPSSSSGSPAVEETPGTLSWVSKYESQIANGPLRIYRAPGSVAFLACQSALKPILPKSQCWEVDAEAGKFVLQIRRPQYWRLEVPNKSDIQKLQVAELKDVLGKVLQFEKTPCPFQRNFTVQLPESPATPVKRRPWKPVERATLSPLSKVDNEPKTTPEFKDSSPAALNPDQKPPPNEAMKPCAVTAASQVSHEVDRLNAHNKDQTVEPEPLSELLTSESSVLSETSEPSPTNTIPDDSIFSGYIALGDNDNFSDDTDDSEVTPRNTLRPAFQAVKDEAESEGEVRPQVLQNCTRSITAPPLLSLITSPPSKNRTKSPLRTSTIADSDSGFSSSVESFHTVQSWHSPLAPPSPPASLPSSPTTYPYPHENIVLPKRLPNARDESEITATLETPQCWEMSPIPDMDETVSPPPRTPTLTEDNRSEDERCEVETPPTTNRSNIRHRATTSSNSCRRELSPLPAAVNLFTPSKRRNKRLQTTRHIPTAIIQKTCEILLSPPSHLFQLMMNIASKIAAGEWRGMLSGGYGESVQWDFEEEYAADPCTEDDFGISLTAQPSRATSSGVHVPNTTGGSWEVD